ncbi:MAG: hypothetical protein M1835_007538 [Candelina submexicana]|nr:MAG: hypothetical protein M1835_007538 [Candelina submexicana]
MSIPLTAFAVSTGLIDTSQAHVTDGCQLKDESHRIGFPAFKILGSSWGIYRTLATRLDLPLTVSIEDLATAAQKENMRLCTATDGNHGRSVARMAKLLGIKAKIIVPEDMDQPTRDNISSEGAQVIVTPGDYDLAVKHADNAAATSGDILVMDTGWPGYEEFPNAMVDGYSTMFLEVDNQLQQMIGKPVNLAIAPVGVGSFAQAVVRHYKSPERKTAVITVEANAAPCLRHALEKGQIAPIKTESTIMCGMNCGTVSYTAWPFLRDGVDACTSISDVESHQAVLYLDSCGINLGPCGAAPLAALRTLCPKDLASLDLGEGSVIVLFGTEGSES